MTEKRKRKISIITEVAILFLIGIITTGFLVYHFAHIFFDVTVIDQTEKHATELADTTKLALTESKAFPWLVEYWFDHGDTLDVEYDASLDENSKTAEKCRIFSHRHPELQINFMNEEQCEALPKEDQKLYAEIMYSLLLTHLNQMKQTSHVEFLYCLVSGDPYEKAFFLFSAAKPGEVRGSTKGKIYTLGTVIDLEDLDKIAIRQAVGNPYYVAYETDKLNYYSQLCSFNDHNVFIGLTFDQSELNNDIAVRTRVGSAVAILHQIILVLICLLLLYIFLLRPLKKIQKNVRFYSDTKDSEAARRNLAKIKSHNELGQLSDDMIDLTKEIDAYMTDIKRITSEQERIETELELASKIQKAMLPDASQPYPERDEFKISASMDPAKEVGGDFYDFFLIDEDHLCMVIADVSDKGVPAALFMMKSKIVISQDAKAGDSPAKILTTANKVISENNPMKQFVTVWIGILEISTGKLMAANAGHEYPVLKPPGGSFELVKDEHDFVVGFMDGIVYNEYELLLEHGTTLFLYTDGVPEAMDASEESFGLERMLATLNEGADMEPDQLLRHVRGTVDGFVKEAEQFDDLTMLCLEYK